MAISPAARRGHRAAWVVVVMTRALAVALLGVWVAGASPQVEENLRRIKAISGAWEKFRHKGEGLWQLHNLEEKLDRSGKVVEREATVYQVVRFEGRSYHRLIQKNGRPLTASEAREEASDEKEWLERWRESQRTGKPFTEVNDNHIRFDEPFLKHFEFEDQGLEEWDGVVCHVMSFRGKKDGGFSISPNDIVLQRLQGKAWVSKETGATMHLEAWLPEPVNIGLVAARIESVNITFEQQVMPNGMWGPKRFEITLKGRAFFKRLDHHQVTTWVFQPLAAPSPAVAAPSPVPAAPVQAPPPAPDAGLQPAK